MNYMLEYIMSALHVDDQIDHQDDIVCDININGNIDGKGIKLNEYVLTLSHIIENNTYIYSNNIKYNLLINIDIYDICVLSCSLEPDINDFINKLDDLIKNKCISLSNHNKFNHDKFNIYNINYELKFNQIDNINLKSYLFPSIPMGLFNIINISPSELESLCCSGLSGSVIQSNNKYFGLIISQNENNILEIMPFEIISDIIKSYIANGNNFSYLPLTIDRDIICFTYRHILKNDIIEYINKEKLIQNNIYIKKYNFKIPYQTYILLFCVDKYIDIEIVRNKKNIIIEETINIKLCKYNFNNIFLNYKETNLQIDIFNFTFKELSEEFLIKNTHKDTCEIKYDNIFNKKKIIYLEKINGINKYDIYLDMKNDVYILHKISGHNINKLTDIKKYLSNKTITFELINPNNDLIKIKA
jgi:hypothetical protein